MTNKLFSIRDEANAITAFAFRNNVTLETLHAGKGSPLVDDPTLSRITDAEMRQIMIEASERMAFLLRLRESDPDEYQRTIHDCWDRYCRTWER